MTGGRSLALSIVVICIVAGSAVWLMRAQAAPLQKKAPMQITWVVAHEPVSLFDNAQIVFANEFDKDSDGTVTIKILGPSDLGSTNGHLSNAQVFEELDSGKAQLATEVVSALAPQDHSLAVLNLPFIFNDTASAESVLDGPVGGELLRTLDASSTATGLAFTFSGGLMGIESDTKEIKSAAELKGLRIGTENGKVAQAALASFGAIPVPIDPQGGALAASQQLASLDGIELPYTRLATTSEEGAVPRYVSETDHSFYLTVIMVSDGFYASLSPQDQLALQKAAQAAAAQEREDSLSLAQQNLEQLRSGGATVIEWNASAEQALQEESRSAYTQFPGLASLVQQIRNAESGQ